MEVLTFEHKEDAKEKFFNKEGLNEETIAELSRRYPKYDYAVTDESSSQYNVILMTHREILEFAKTWALHIELGSEEEYLTKEIKDNPFWYYGVSFKVDVKKCFERIKWMVWWKIQALR